MESTRGYLNFSLVLSSCYIKSICSHLNLTHRPYTIKAVFVLLLFKIAISASCLLRRLYKIYMVWPSLLFKIYVPRHINFINGYIHFILFSYYSHLIYAISHILFTRPTERTAWKYFFFILWSLEIQQWQQGRWLLLHVVQSSWSPHYRDLSGTSIHWSCCEHWWFYGCSSTGSRLRQPALCHL